LYVADGSPAVFFDDHNGDGVINATDGDRVWLYFGLRRGGRVLYALDVTSKDAPLFMWKIKVLNDAGAVAAEVCTAAACAGESRFNELGQTWSTPAIARIKNLGVGSNPPALIFGGGYDPAEDSMPVVNTARSMGRAVYVVNGYSGAIIQSWGTGGQGGTVLGGSMSYAVPSDVVALDTDLDGEGFIDRAYVGDLGGNVWRFDIDNANAGQWQATQIASLSDPSGEKRKFFFPPAAAKQSITLTQGGTLRFDAIYIGSGDKEHPRCLTQDGVTIDNPNPCPRYAANDKIFMIMDRDVQGPAQAGSPIQIGDLIPIANGCSSSCANLDSSSKGWARGLDPGEKVTNSPTVFFGFLRFGTYAPLGQIDDCTPLGQGRLNELNALSGDVNPNVNTTSGAVTHRYYLNFLTRGYVSTGQVLIVGKTIYHVVVSDAQLHSVQIGTMGSATKIYWYLETEQ
jgi:type IV pilus assembly protein PilY1